MARKLSTKNRKMARDRARAYAANPVEQTHKVAVERSRKAKLKKAYRK